MIARTKIETFIIFQSLMGVGHLARCSAIASALDSISHVTMFSGGKSIDGWPIPSGVDFVQMPALRRDRSISDIFPVPVEPGYTLTEIERMRSELLVHSYFRKKPRIIIIEFFPFAPKRYGNAFDELFDAINKERERPTVVCSLRAYPRLWDTDTSPAWINAQLRKNFSCVLHHADWRFFPVNSLGPYIESALSGVSVKQTGFVRRPLIQTADDHPPNGLLLTAGGGGPFGARLLKRWINAAKAGSADLFPINVVCGPLMDSDDQKRLRAQQDENITVHDSVANLDELICSSRAIVCLGGYNTLVEALSLGKPVLAFPVGERGDQTFQVNTLHSHGMLLKGDQSQSDHEITALMNKLLSFRPDHSIDCNGAERSVEIIRQLVSAS